MSDKANRAELKFLRDVPEQNSPPNADFFPVVVHFVLVGACFVEIVSIVFAIGYLIWRAFSG